MVQNVSMWKILTKRKNYANEAKDEDTKLKRALSLWDLTALGIGSTLGAGVYVLAGQIAKEQAGPSVMISFAIAAVASLFAGMCYAEFGARVPKAGSAYIYSYVCIGEFVAFVIGWNLILEYIIGTASVCRGISLYLDTLINDTLKNSFASVAPMDISFFGSYFDFFAFGLVLVFGAALSFGVETSAMANNICTILNLSVLIFVIVAGSIKANVANWNVDPSSTEGDAAAIGSGGYFPFGIAGTLKGAATCFYGFVGFDTIATSGEEVRNPRRNIPRSIMLTLFVVFLCYFGVSAVLTLMVPYYAQDPNAPLPYAFKQVGWDFAMWIVAIGGLLGLFASLVGALFPVPRIMYSMAADGLLFNFLGKISPRFQVPVTGSMFAAFLTAALAGLFDLNQLVNLLSIGTLLAYTMVAVSVTILRFMDSSKSSSSEQIPESSSENKFLTSTGNRITFCQVLKQLFNCNRQRKPSTLSTRVVGGLLLVFCILCIGIGLIFLEAYDSLINNQLWVFIVLGVLGIVMIITLLAISLQPRETYRSIFRVPLVPLVPALSIFINIYLMLQLDPMTWIRFGIWMAIGIPIFLICWCLYGRSTKKSPNFERISFAQALSGGRNDQSNSPEDSIETKNHSTNNNKLAPSNPNNINSSANGTVATLPMGFNEMSVKSVDEIQNLNDVSDELVEMKQNGKIFYVMDTRNSSASASENEDTKSKYSINTAYSEDENAVMEMFDNMIQGEEENSKQYNSLERQFSVDSELLPSVIESTTVATVHSSTSGSYENDLGKVSEGDSETENPQAFNLNHHLQKKLQYHLAAQSFVDELFSSEEFWTRFENRKATFQPGGKEPSEKPGLTRSSSSTSILSSSSFNDPLHSTKFKNKLSKLILQPPPVIPNKTNESRNPLYPKEGETTTNEGLKHSRSEPDIKKLVLKVIQESNLTEEDLDGSKTATGLVPKPPKFDPILYKTINTLGNKKSRPSLKPLMTTPEPKALVKDETLPSQEPLENLSQENFKLKLESILKRGPSHKSQQRPDVIIRRPKSMHTDDHLQAESSFVQQNDFSRPNSKIKLKS